MKPQELAEEFEQREPEHKSQQDKLDDDDEEDPEQVTQDLELEIALIMKRGGLTREAAVKHLLERTQSEVIEGSRSSDPDPNTPSVSAPPPPC